MKIKLILGLIVTASLSAGLCGAFAQNAPKAKPQLPPLPPGLVYADDGKIKEVPIARVERKSVQPKKESVVANNPAPGTPINEPAGAALPEKKPAQAAAPQP